MRWSVAGSKACNRVVIHPDVTLNENELKDEILKYRGYVDTLISDAIQLAELLKKSRQI